MFDFVGFGRILLLFSSLGLVGRGRILLVSPIGFGWISLYSFEFFGFLYWILLGSFGFCWILSDFHGFPCWIALGFVGFSSLLEFVGVSWILLDFGGSSC